MKPAAIIARLSAHPMLTGWHVDYSPVHDLPDPANIEIDHDLKRARLRVRPEWQIDYQGTETQLIAHELGHIFTDDVFRFIKPTPATREAEERLATRFGMMLIDRAPA